jgi:hypothetical protein
MVNPGPKLLTPRNILNLELLAITTRLTPAIFHDLNYHASKFVPLIRRFGIRPRQDGLGASC